MSNTMSNITNTTKTDKHIHKSFQASLAYLKGVALKEFNCQLPEWISKQIPVGASKSCVWSLDEGKERFDDIDGKLTLILNHTIYVTVEKLSRIKHTTRMTMALNEGCDLLMIQAEFSYCYGVNTTNYELIGEVTTNFLIPEEAEEY